MLIISSGTVSQGSCGGVGGLEIPYTGYVELTVEVLSKIITWRDWLVVKDPPGQMSQSAVPGVSRMNAIRESYDELFGQHGLKVCESLVSVYIKYCIS